jgi:hypothetical protein
MTRSEAQPWIGARHSRFPAAFLFLEDLLAISLVYRKTISVLSAGGTADISGITTRLSAG